MSVNNEPPEYDFAVRVNGDSITSLFSDGQIIYVTRVFETSEARNNQFVITVDDDFEVVGVVVI